MLDLVGLDMTAEEFKTHIGTQCCDASLRFGQIYETCEYRLGEYKSQVKHLQNVIESMSGERNLTDVISRLENPAMLLEMLNALGLDNSDIERAYDRGEAAWNEAREAGNYGVAAALAKAAAAIRESIYGEQPDDSEQEAAA